MGIALTRKNYRDRSTGFGSCIRIFIAGGLSLLQSICMAQCPSSQQVYGQLRTVENDGKLLPAEKLPRVFALQKIFDRCPLPKDSVYARILHRIGTLENAVGNPNEAIAYTQASARINTAKAAGSNLRLAVNSYYNLGYYNNKLHRYKAALAFYDSCVYVGNAFTDSATLAFVLYARNNKADIYFTAGDYDKAIAEATFGLQTATAINDRKSIFRFLNQRVQASGALSRIKEALADAAKAASLAEENKAGTKGGPGYEGEVAYTYEIKAAINEADGNFSKAMAYHQKSIRLRSRTKDSITLANDYLNVGNSAWYQSKQSGSRDFSAAKRFYSTALLLARQQNMAGAAVKALNNLAAISFSAGSFADALRGYHESLLQTIPGLKDTNPSYTPSYRQCTFAEDKNFLSLLLDNKAECLLRLYKQSGKESYLNAALRTALLTDSLITDMRHEQTGEQSKLYWRNQTRAFFANALEACYSAHDAAFAFYFMEKSRAVLLNDKLNELGAAAQLPPAEAAREQALQNNVFALQQKLAGLSDTDTAYGSVQLKLFAAKESLTRFLQNTEARFPAYYQYKYADDVPSLGDLQRYLLLNRQSFVHYFTTDTAVYVLAVTASSTLLLKQKSGNTGAKLFDFLAICSNVQQLNSNYDSFAHQAFNLYAVLFKPLALPKGRVIVCSDAAAIPFEALTTDDAGKNFLLNDYSFSYVYAARHLLKKFTNPPGNGNFLGVAPVAYAAHLGLQPLLQSADSLNALAAYYQNAKLLTGNEANAKSFLRQWPRYTVVAVFSHARADSADKEPVLFMADSGIGLSQLQQLQSPATQLMVLSACQTNAGRLATGEGVFSLARGFAAAGIPAITATVWKADEGAIYAVSQTFLQNIAAGMRKDDALRNAKLSYLQSGANKNALPYYWANMIVVGNAEPVALSKKTSWRWWAGGAITVAVLASLLFIRKKKLRAVF